MPRRIRTHIDMPKQKDYEPPKREPGDVAYAIARAGISSIPLAGAAATELLQLLLSPPLEKRRDEWMKTVGQALLDLENSRGVKLEDLQTNEAFVSVVMQASQAAVRNHQEEKVRALRNAVINSTVATEIETDLYLQLIRYVDELRPSHLVLLKFLSDHEAQYASTNSYEQLYQHFVAQNLLKADREEFKLLCTDLIARFLLRISPDVEDFDGIFTSDAIITGSPKKEGPMLRITSIGKQLLALIADST